MAQSILLSKGFWRPGKERGNHLGLGRMKSAGVIIIKDRCTDLDVFSKAP